YELGYRVQPRDNLSFDFAAYTNDYDKLRGIDSSVTPPRFSNEGEGTGHGLETAVRWAPTPRWHLTGSYNYQHLDIHKKAGSSDTSIAAVDRTDPHHQALLRSAWDLPRNWTLDGTLRYVSELPDGKVPA